MDEYWRKLSDGFVGWHRCALDAAKSSVDGSLWRRVCDWNQPEVRRAIVHTGFTDPHHTNTSTQPNRHTDADTKGKQHHSPVRTWPDPDPR